MEGIWQEVSQWLEERTADIGFFSYQENMPFEWIPLAEDPMVALLPRSHPLAEASCYPLENCEQDSFIMLSAGLRRRCGGAFRPQPCAPQYPVYHHRELFRHVHGGAGAGCQRYEPAHHGKAHLRRGHDPHRPAPASITLGAALHSHTEASPAVKMFLKYAVRMLTRTES